MISQQFSEAELLQRIQTLPEDVQRVLLTSETNEFLLKIASEHSLSENDKLTLRQITALTLMGLKPVSGFSEQVKAEIKSPEINALIREIEEKILNPVSKLLIPLSKPPGIQDISPDNKKAVPTNSTPPDSKGTPDPAPQPVVLHQESSSKPLEIPPSISQEMHERMVPRGAGANLIFPEKTLRQTERQTEKKPVVEIQFGIKPSIPNAAPTGKPDLFDSSKSTPFTPAGTPANSPKSANLPSISEKTFVNKEKSSHPEASLPLPPPPPPYKDKPSPLPENRPDANNASNPFFDNLLKRSTPPPTPLSAPVKSLNAAPPPPPKT